MLDSSKNDFLTKLREITIHAIFSDKFFQKRLALKGGNLLDLVYKMSSRSSLDLDFSMEGEFEQGEINKLKNKIKRLLSASFKKEGLVVFDINIQEKPKSISDELQSVWGGYEIDFKIITKEKYRLFKSSLDSRRRNAAVVAPGQRRKMLIQISKFEYCSPKEKREFNGITIFVYSPLMVVFEKLRAICQQRPEYRKVLKTHERRERARDFIDIYDIFNSFKINLNQENMLLLEKIFSAKRVPLLYLKSIYKDREFHSHGFPAVKATIHSEVELREFDYYFDYVLTISKELETIGKI